jgi:hypothetical protein
MVVVPLTMPANEADAARRSSGANSSGADSMNWIRVAAAGTLATSGVLLVTGRRRAGLLAAASGTALAMLDQKQMVRAWWEALPGYLAEVQSMLGRVQGAVDELSAQRDKLHRVLSK